MAAEVHDWHVCNARFAFALDNFIRRLFQKPEKITGPYIRPGDTVIDIGCGPGFFTIDMAKMVGDAGRVVAVDLQRKMLEKVKKKAGKYGLAKRIVPHRCAQDGLGLDNDIKADFILAFYMVHETPDPGQFLSEVRPLLNDQGRFLIVEPRFHVSKNKFEKFAGYAVDAGFTTIDRPAGKGGRSLLLGT